MAIIVQKYGGTSVGAVEKIKNVARRVIATKNSGKQVVVVVSAMGHTTDEMIALQQQLTAKPNPREYDAFLANGEDISATLVAMAILDQGEKAISLNGLQAGILTENIHIKAKIVSIDTTRIQKELDAGKIVVITGFQGVNEWGDITTIGRGGSDTSAVALAASLKAEACEIYTDVDGVYSADPRKVPAAQKLKEISADEMLELASLGAGVLHPRAVETAKLNDMNIVVKDAHSNREGTYVRPKLEKTTAVSGVTVDSNCSKISILKIADQPGVAGKIFTALAEGAVNVDVIVQSTHETIGKNDISFTVAEDDFDQAMEVTRQIQQQLKAETVNGDRNVAKISIVGVGMISTPGVAAKLFRTLGENQINIEMISTSEIKISCVIDQAQAEKALRAVHTAFGLDTK
jgi:aspartate kinase